MSARRPSTAVALLVPSFTLLAAGAVAVYAAFRVGAANTTLVTALQSPTATAADVYGGQSEVQIASSLLVAGIVGVVIALAVFGVLIALGAFSGADESDDVESDDDTADEGFEDEVVVAEALVPAPAAAAAPAAPAAEPALAPEAEPAVATETAPVEATPAPESTEGTPRA